MVKNVDRRLSNLEHDSGGGDKTTIEVNWRTDDLILDHDTDEYITEDEWRRRHPNIKLVIVTWDDLGDDDNLTPIPVA